MKFAIPATPADQMVCARRKRSAAPACSSVQQQSTSSTGVQRSTLGGHSELGAFGTVGVRKWGRNRAVKTHRLVCLYVCRMPLAHSDHCRRLTGNPCYRAIEVEPTGKRGHMATRCGQNALKVEKIRRQYLENQTTEIYPWLCN